jgi:hypothetical protein
MIVKILIPPLIGLTIARICLVWGIMHLTKTFLFALSMSAAGFLLSLLFSWLILLHLLALLNICLTGQTQNHFTYAFNEIKNRQLAALGIVVLTVIAQLLGFIIWLICSITAGILLVAALGKTSGLAIVIPAASLVIIAAVTLVGQFMGVALALVAFEKKTFSHYLKESILIIAGDFGKAASFALLLGVAIYLVAVPLSIPITALSAFTALSHSLTSQSDMPRYMMKMPLTTLVLTEIWGSFISLIIWSLTCISYGLYYKYMTVRRYGVDLDKQLDVLVANKV